ncbi:hypothetical protein Tco_0610472 [Tanacetum coccineum]
MIDCLSIVKTDKVIRTVETNKVKLIVKIESFGMSADKFDKETMSSDGLQPKQADLSCVHALNELHLHEIHVVPRKASFILGIKIYIDRSKRLIELSQSAYMDKILKRYWMDNSKRGYIPMQEILDLNKTQGALTPEEVKRMQNVPYASTIGSIMYAVRCTRPNVAFTQNNKSFLTNSRRTTLDCCHTP